MRPTRGTLRNIAVVCSLVTFITCSDATGPGNERRINEILLDPLSASVASLGEAIDFSARVLDRNGRELSQTNLTWMSSDTTILVSEGAGRFRSRANGSAIVSVGPSHDAQFPRSSATVTVRQAAARVEIAQDSLALFAIGQMIALRGNAFDARGNALTGSETPVWESGNTAVATIDQDGEVTARADGEILISLRSGSTVKSIPARVVSTFQISGCVTFAEKPSAQACNAASIAVRIGQ